MLFHEDRLERAPWLKAHPVEAVKPALCIPARRGCNGGLMVYVVENPDLTSMAQRKEFEDKAAAGYRVVLCATWDQARTQIKAYLTET